jgi:hypothetical protein
MPVELAKKVFIESGDLPITEFPALLEVAVKIAEALNLNNNGKQGREQQTLEIHSKRQALTFEKPQKRMHKLQSKKVLRLQKS